MKLMAGIMLFGLCALAGEGRARRLRRRERTLSGLCDLIREIGDRQMTGLVSFREAAMACSPSREKEQLLCLLQDKTAQLPLLTAEETARLAAYARSDSRSVASLRLERDALVSLLERNRDKTKEELAGKGQVYRSVGYLTGAAALLLVL